MTDETPISASPGYAVHRLQRALQTALNHEDLEVRRRAEAKVERWQAVLEGMASGNLDVGSRTPVADTPAWVTLEVAHGGFATGRYLAEGPLLDHETASLETLPDDPGADTDRARINRWYLSDEGQDELREALAQGRYRVDVPEEGAWLVVAWLVDHGRESEALDLIEALMPLIHRLRFYPRLEPIPRPAGESVRVATVQEVRAALEAIEPRPQIVAMNEAHSVWAPLYDELVALWLDTVEGDAPHLIGPADAAKVHGGWPCKRWPEDWEARRAAWRARYAEAVASSHVCGKHHHPKSNFCRLEEALVSCPKDSSALSGRDVGWIRRALANTVTRHGLPASPERRALRAMQLNIADRPAHASLAEVVFERLAAYPPEGGLASLDPFRRTVAADEHPKLPAGTPIPEAYVRKVARALEAPVGDLVDRGVIGSGEVLALVLPQITAQVAAAGIDDPALRGLFGAIYAAFRRRRSLLLLNLEHQIRIEELPWIAALTGLRQDDLGTRNLARQTLEQVTLLALCSFPQTILPNPLVREMGALAKRADLEIPLLEEVAADIFMGTFTAKWSDAAAVTWRTLEGTLYARYYDLPAPPAPGAAGGLLDKVKARWGKKTADNFAGLCSERASEAGTGKASFVAKNGAILEQSQILTTHNLAVLVDRLAITDRLRVLAPELASACLRWVVRRQNQTLPNRHAELIMLKNTAYAWRQALFYLSLCPEPAQRAALDDLQAAVGAVEDSEWRDRFAPVVEGLRAVLDGERFDASGRAGRAGRRWLGWSVGKHWLSRLG